MAGFGIVIFELQSIQIRSPCTTSINSTHTIQDMIRYNLSSITSYQVGGVQRHAWCIGGERVLGRGGGDGELDGIAQADGLPRNQQWDALRPGHFSL